MGENSNPLPNTENGVEEENEFTPSFHFIFHRYLQEKPLI